jgi:hypothetical protein
VNRSRGFRAKAGRRGRVANIAAFSGKRRPPKLIRHRTAVERHEFSTEKRGEPSDPNGPLTSAFATARDDRRGGLRRQYGDAMSN